MCCELIKSLQGQKFKWYYVLTILLLGFGLYQILKVLDFELQGTAAKIEASNLARY